jgi:indole-3-glycerol phosphate synthase
VVAEIKRRSPSGGTIAAVPDARTLANAYRRGGAAAVSILTEDEHFGGSLDDLTDVANEGALDGLPLLRKDFVLDPLQVVESRAAGASAILLIARVLDGPRFDELMATAREWDLGVLAEAHDAAELDRVLAHGAAVVGVNARDLESFEVHTDRLHDLLPRVPPEAVAVAESGIGGVADVQRLAGWGADAVLVGRYLASHPDPASGVRSLISIPRVGRPGGGSA